MKRSRRGREVTVIREGDESICFTGVAAWSPWRRERLPIFGGNPSDPFSGDFSPSGCNYLA